MGMTRTDRPDVVVVGSVGIDDIETPRAKRRNLLGGSASYACAAASFFRPTGMVGVVGTDFPARHRATYRRFGIDLAGLQVAGGRTFRWGGVYAENMNERRTLFTELNVFAGFSPELPPHFRAAPFLFLANIQPALQAHVLSQVRRPRFILLDTMDLWINTAKADLLKVIRRVDMLTVNESEAQRLAGEHNVVRAARKLLKLGPRYVAIKRGEYGSLLFHAGGMAIVPAYPLEKVADPTGAGDTFAGAFLGALARGGKTGPDALRAAMTYGSVVASFGVEDFSLGRLARCRPAEIEARARALRAMGAVR
jgi:sugar/nucleoside kinase (ribokinase family)